MAGQDELYMQRCLQLAALAAGQVAPNPMVGAVLVCENRIIGEGYHEKYGEAHAEVNCIASVKESDKELVKKSVLYVSLEPCAHYGKTPPCADFIIGNKIPKVVIGCRDPFEQVNGKGIEKLKAAGISVECNVLENECKNLNKRFFTFHTKQQPYIILKWAQTADKKIAANNNKPLVISNYITNRIVHKWRAEEAAILVGTNTVKADDPLLTNRLWFGKNPVRLVIDKNLKLADHYKIFNKEAPTILFNCMRNTFNSFKEKEEPGNEVYFYKLEAGKNFLKLLTQACYKLNLQSILIEGGAKLLQSFIDENLYDEVRIITNKSLFIGKGVKAPEFNTALTKFYDERFNNDYVEFFQ